MKLQHILKLKKNIMMGEIVALYRERIVKTVEIGTQKSFVAKIELFAKFTNDKFEFIVTDSIETKTFDTLFDASNYVENIQYKLRKVCK